MVGRGDAMVTPMHTGACGRRRSGTAFYCLHHPEENVTSSSPTMEAESAGVASRANVPARVPCGQTSKNKG